MNFNYSNYFYFYEDINKKGNIFFTFGGYNYYIGLEDVFDVFSNEAKNLLDTIYEYSKKINSGYIDTEVWLYYLTTSKITLPPLVEQFITNESFNDIDIKIGRNGKSSNLKLHKEEFTENKLFKTKPRSLFPSKKIDTIKTNLEIDDDFYIASKKIVYYNDEIELLFSIMNCLFSTRRKYYIKKCDLCENYYVANKSDWHYCRRIKMYNNKNLTCDAKVAVMQKSYEYKSNYEPLNKEFLKRINDMPDGKEKDKYKKRYKKERDLKKLEYFKTGNINILIEFINNYEIEHPFT